MSFQPGNQGRPKGAKGKKLELFRSNNRKLQRKVLDMALEGDVSMLKLIADRLWPRIRPQALPIRIVTDSSDLAVQGKAIITAALKGELTADVLRDLLSALTDQARLVEFSSLETRLQALENQEQTAPWEKAKPKRKRHTLLA